MSHAQPPKIAANNGRALTLTAEQNVPADGQSYSKIEAIQSQITSGEAIIFSCSGSALFDNGSTLVTAVTDVLGVAQARLSNRVAENVTVTVLQSSLPGVQERIQVTFGAGVGIFPPPHLQESSGGNIIIGEVTTTQVHVQILPWSGMKAGDSVALSWAGTLANGSAGPEAVFPHDVSTGEVGSALSFAVTVASLLTPYADGGVLTLLYTVNEVLSEAAVITVDGVGSGLTPPVIAEANDGVLLPTGLDSVTLIVPPWQGMATQDLLTYHWKGTPANGNAVTLSDAVHIPGLSVGKPVHFTLDAAEAVLPFDGGHVEVWYRVEPKAGGETLTSLHQTYRVGEAALLPAPVVEEADAGEIDPESVSGSLHVQVRYPAITGGDAVQVRWQGYRENGTAGPLYQPTLHIATVGEAAQKQVRINIPTAELDPYLNGRVVVSYTVVRNGSSEALISAVSEYAVHHTSGQGNLWVIGARYRAGTYHQYNSLLVALDADSRQPQSAVWQYEGEATSITATRFRDSQPERALVVRNGRDVVRLRPANLAGSINKLMYSAFSARLDDGAVVAWGDVDNGGNGSSVAHLRDIVSVTGSAGAFAALRTDGLVASWGDVAYGGDPAIGSWLQDSVAVTGNYFAFAALRVDGSVAAWGEAAFGGNASTVANLRDIVSITGSGSAFAALRVDGSVVAWGNIASGGNASTVANLRDIVSITGSGGAFAALRVDGSVVAWGHTDSGGNASSVANLRDIVSIAGAGDAFAALRADGSVVAWGNANYGGDASTVANLRDIVSVTGAGRAFTAQRSDGSVVAWGQAASGGDASTVANLRDIVSVTGNGLAFAAQRSDGSVVAWGNASYGGSVPAEIAGLRNIRAIYTEGIHFMVLSDEGTVHVWGGSALPPPADVQLRISYQLPARPRLRTLPQQ